MSRFRNAICHTQECKLSLSNAPKSYICLRKFIFLSAVAALAVSLSQHQNDKSCDGSEEELEPGVKTEKTECKCSLNAVKSTSGTISTRESSSA